MALWPDVGTRYLQENIVPGEGVDTFTSPVQLSQGQASDMQDFGSYQYPALRSRPGRHQLYAPVANYSVTKMHMTPTGTLHCIVSGLTSSGGNDWYAWNTTTSAWDLVEAHGTHDSAWTYSLCDWYDSASSTWWVYCIRHDGASGYTITWWDGSGAVDRVAYATFPVVAGPICTHLNRMFSCKSGAIVWSKLKNPALWTVADGGGETTVGSGDNIKVLLSMPDRLFIGTDKGIYVLFGSGDDSFALKPVTQSIGIPNGHLACVNESTVYFSDGQEIYEYRNGQISNITRAGLNNGVYGGFAEHSITTYCMATDGNRLYVSAPGSNRSITPPDWYVFDIHRRRWYIEQGTYANGMNALYNCMTRSNDNYVLASESWGALINPTAMYVAPRVRKIDPAYYSDDITQYNWVNDGMINDADNWTPVGGVDLKLGIDPYYVSGDGSAATIATYQDTARVLGTTTYVYASVEVLVTDAVCQSVQFHLNGSTLGSVLVASQATPTINTWYRLAAIKDVTGATGYLRPYISATYANAVAANGKIMKVRYVLVDDISFTYDTNDLPAKADYESDLSAALWFSKTNSTTAYHMSRPVCTWISPAYQIAPSAKKTLQYIWVTLNVVDASTITVSTVPSAEGGTFTNSYLDSSVSLATGHRVVKCKVKMNATSGSPQKSEYVRVRIYGVGTFVVENITLDWRVAGRAK